jgi:hypothetical protein
MVASYRLHNWTFNVWEGPPPEIPLQRISIHTRPGAVGCDHTNLGYWGDKFTRRLTSYYSGGHLEALDDRQLIVAPLLQAGLVRLWYASIDYLVRYQMLFKVTDLQVIECASYVRVTGSGLNLANPGVLKVDVTMVAHAVAVRRP